MNRMLFAEKYCLCFWHVKSFFSVLLIPEFGFSSGLFSALIREQTLMSGSGSKWMIMDGDIDPMWIESLNTVMDDNKVSTFDGNN